MKKTICFFFIFYTYSLFANVSVNLTPEAMDLKLRRELTGLGFAYEMDVFSILEFIKSKRGASKPIYQDEVKSQQYVLIDAQGIRWTSETDGGVVEVQDERGRNPLVFETKTEWFNAREVDRMLLSFESLVNVGAVPYYQYGGGHIKIKLKSYFEKHPLQFASLVNLFLNYEPILNHLMMHKKRHDFAIPLGMTRMSPAQLKAAGLNRDARTTLAEYLGEGLNAIINNPTADCRIDTAVKRRYDEEQKPQLSIQENCVLAWLSHFSSDVVGMRECGINLQSWRGAANSMRLKEAIELRFFNAPTNYDEATLEEALVRAMADQAIRAFDHPILFNERVEPFYDLDSYYRAYFPQKREEDFGELLRTSGFDEKSVQVYFNQYLDEERWAFRRFK